LSEHTIAKTNTVSLIEKAAGRLTASERPLEPFSERPSDEHAERPPVRFKRPLEARAAKPAAATSGEREVARLDFQRLEAAGFITRDTTQTRTSEEFRLIKRSILRTYKEANDPNSNIIMVTSALSGEGKTFTAINLAMSIAFERDFRVLLVDADVRKADILGHLGIKPGRGLVDVLVDGTLDLSDVMIRTDFEGLTILASGMSHSLSTELLASKGMADLIDEISRRYADRIVVFDTPPVLLASEAAALAPHVGQTVFVVKAESTSREIVKEALEVLKPARNVALVLNAVHPQLGQTKFAYGSSKLYPGGTTISAG
jgi:exopolysaccharide/PEP-CTERM locus tyrosine autokinase